MPDRTIERIEQAVDRLAGRTPSEGLPAPKSPSHPDAITRAAAWGIIVLFLAVPLLATLTVRSRVLWGVWAAISIWAAVDSQNVGAALPKRPTISDGTLVLALALLNLLTAVCALFVPR